MIHTRPQVPLPGIYDNRTGIHRRYDWVHDAHNDHRQDRRYEKNDRFAAEEGPQRGTPIGIIGKTHVFPCDLIVDRSPEFQRIKRCRHFFLFIHSLFSFRQFDPRIHEGYQQISQKNTDD